MDTSTRYRVTATPIESRTEGDRTVVVAKVWVISGQSVNLVYRFGSSADRRIKKLEVR